jgi:ribosomal protein S18 acetylase RimI-like enzyme
VGLARRSFDYSRFHLDSVIPASVADTIKAEWAGNYFAGQRGDEMVVAVMRGTVVGFLLLLRGDKGVLNVDLIAVDRDMRRKGISSDMIAYAESQCRNCSRILVGTQVANVPSIRLYEKIGFRLFASHYVFHYHNPPRNVE